MIPIVGCTFGGLIVALAITFQLYDDDVNGFGALIGIVVGAFLGIGLALWIGGSLLPYQTVTQTQQLVQMQDTQGIHQGFYLQSSVEKIDGDSVTVYYYDYEVSGGYNPGHVPSSDGTVTVNQNPSNTEATLTDTQTSWAEGWFWLFGLETRSHTIKFDLPKHSYQPGDQITSGN